MQKMLGENIFAVKQIVNNAKTRLDEPPDYLITLKRQEETRALLKEIVTYPALDKKGVQRNLKSNNNEPVDRTGNFTSGSVLWLI